MQPTTDKAEGQELNRSSSSSEELNRSSSSGGGSSDRVSDEIIDEFDITKNLSPAKSPPRTQLQGQTARGHRRNSSSGSPSPFKSSSPSSGLGYSNRSRFPSCSEADMSYSESECSASVSLGLSLSFPPPAPPPSSAPPPAAAVVGARVEPRPEELPAEVTTELPSPVELSVELLPAPSVPPPEDYVSPLVTAHKIGAAAVAAQSPGASSATPSLAGANALSRSSSRNSSRNDLSMVSNGEGDLAAGEGTSKSQQLVIVEGMASADRDAASEDRPAPLGVRTRRVSDGSASSANAPLRGVAHVSPAKGPPRQHPSLDSPSAIPCSLPNGAGAARAGSGSGAGAVAGGATRQQQHHRRHRSEGGLNLASSSSSASRGRAASASSILKKPLVPASASGGGGTARSTQHRRSTSLESSLQVIFENQQAAASADAVSPSGRLRLRRSLSASPPGAVKRAKHGNSNMQNWQGKRPWPDSFRSLRSGSGDGPSDGTETPERMAERILHQHQQGRLPRSNEEASSSASIRAGTAATAAQAHQQHPQHHHHHRAFARGALIGFALSALLVTSLPPALLDLLVRHRLSLLLPLLGLGVFSGGRCCESDHVVVQVKFPAAAFRRLFGALFLAAVWWCFSEEAARTGVPTALAGSLQDGSEKMAAAAAGNGFPSPLEASASASDGGGGTFPGPAAGGEIAEAGVRFDGN